MPDDWLDGGGSGSTVDVRAVLDSAGGEALYELVELGALVSLGKTRDGGALGVTVTVDGRWRRDYFRDSEELTDWASEALPAVRSAIERLAAASDRGSRPRRSRSL